jgi:2-methylcitrate dehydratase
MHACVLYLNLLTKAGQPGAPTVLTAPQWDFYHTMLHDKEIKIVRPYSSWVMETVFFKLVPAEGHAISAAEAAVTVAQQLTARELSAEKHVKSVRIRTQKPAFTIVNKEGKLHNAADRDHCLQYIIAVIMLKGTVIETADYMNESPWAQDPRVDLLREKMVVVEDEGFTRDYHDQKVRSGANAILVELTKGRISCRGCGRVPCRTPEERGNFAESQSQVPGEHGVQVSERGSG